MAVRRIPIDIAGLEFEEMTAWGTTSGAFTKLQARNIKAVVEVEVIPNETQKPQPNRGPEAAIVAGKGGTLTFEIALRGGAGAESEFSKLAKNCGLDRNTFAGAPAKVTGGTVDTVVGLTADIGTIVVGDVVLVEISAEGTIEMRMVTRVQDTVPAAPDTTLDVFPAFTGAPVNTDDFYAVDSLIPTATTGEPTKYLGFKAYTGSGGTDRLLFTLSNCSGTWKLNSVGANAEPVIEFTIQIDTWVQSEASMTTGADAYNASHPLLGDICYIDDVATFVASLEFDPANAPVAYVTTAGLQGRSAWIFTGAAEPKLAFVPYHDIDWYAKLLAATLFEFAFESIKDADEAWGIFCPDNCQLLKLEAGDAGNGLLSATPELQLNDPGQNADSVDLPRWAIGITGA